MPEKLEDFQNFKSEAIMPGSSGQIFLNSSLKIITNLKEGAKLENSLHLEDTPVSARERVNSIDSSPIVHKISIKGSRREM